MNSYDELEVVLDEAAACVKTSRSALEEIVTLRQDIAPEHVQRMTRFTGTLRDVEREVDALLRMIEPAAPEDADQRPSLSVDDQRRCALCNGVIRHHDRHIPTSDGAIVHVACAEQSVAATTARRNHVALRDGAVLALAVFGFAIGFGVTPWLLAPILAGIGLHVLTHRRWWYYLRRDLLLWLLYRSRS